MSKLPIEELTRLAFVWAEQDRTSLADCWGHGTPERKEAASQAKQLRDYRLKRWGKTKLERVIGTSITVPVSEIFHNHKP